VPALALLVLAPLLAEYLLGDFSVRQIGFLPFFIPQYGGGALLVREIARRSGKGWQSILLLALAYALVEEGFTTGTLFNPNWGGHHLLDYGYVAAFGTSLVWVVFVLTLHVVWSIGSAVAVAEGLAGPRWRSPWLGRIGLAVTSLVFVIGCALTVAVTRMQNPFVATPAQYASAAAAVVLAVSVAFLRRPATHGDSSPPSVGTIVGVSFALCSAFHLLHTQAPMRGWNPGLVLAGMVLLVLAAIAMLSTWSRRTDWGATHTLAAATGAILTYGWLSLTRMARGSTAIGWPTTTADVLGQAILLIGVLFLVQTGARRLHPLT
jgi:hypothetical protein